MAIGMTLKAQSSSSPNTRSQDVNVKDLRCRTRAIWLRVMLALDSIKLNAHPENFCAYYGKCKRAVKTYRWERAEKLVTGYMSLSNKDAGEMLQRSGQRGVFISRLARDAAKREKMSLGPGMKLRTMCPIGRGAAKRGFLPEEVEEMTWASTPRSKQRLGLWGFHPHWGPRKVGDRNFTLV